MKLFTAPNVKKQKIKKEQNKKSNSSLCVSKKSIPCMVTGKLMLGISNLKVVYLLLHIKCKVQSLLGQETTQNLSTQMGWSV